MIATSLSLSAFTASVDQFVSSKADDQHMISAEEKALQVEREANATAINAYFSKNNMPLAGYGMKMVLEAEKNDLDWRLIPAIAIRESTGGVFACKSKKAPFNPFGWNSCKSGFKSYDNAIESVAEHLGGNNARTARYYDNKTVKAILQTYNPPSVIPNYAGEVIALMNKIGVDN